MSASAQDRRGASLPQAIGATLSAEYLQIKPARPVSGAQPINTPQRPDSGFEPAKERYVPPEPPLGMEFSWLPNMLWRRRGLILGTAILGPLLALLYVSISPPLYTASTRILIESRAPKIISSESVVPDLGSPDAAVLSQVEVLRSSHLADRVIRELGLFGVTPRTAQPRNLAEPSNDAADGTSPELAPEIDPLPSGPIASFMRRLNVHRVDPTSLIEVSYTDSDPARAARTANAIADLYLDDQVRAKNVATRRANHWLGTRLAQLKEQVRQREEEIERFKAEHNLFDIGEQSLSERMLSVTSDQLVSAQTAADAAQAKLDQVERLKADRSGITMPGTTLQSELLKEFRRQYADVTRKKTNLTLRFGAQHSEVLNAEAELNDLEKQIDQEIVRTVDTARDEFEAAKSQVALLEEKVEQLKKQLIKGNKVAVDLAELKREAAATSNLYASLLTRFHETEAQESLHSPDARIVSMAVPPLSPSHPRKSLALILALASSLTLALTLAFVRELTEHVFRSQKDIERVLGINYVAGIKRLGSSEPGAERRAWGKLIVLLGKPFADMLQRLRDWRAHAHALARSMVPRRWRGHWHDSAAHALHVLRPADPIMRPLLKGGASDFSDALFLVKNAIDSRTARGAPKIVAVVSAEAGEGKSTLALGLADYVTSCGGSALLVDGDLRGAALTRLLAPETERSIADVVTSDARSADVLTTDATSGFDFSPAPLDTSGQRTVDVLNSPKIAQMLEELKSNYDLIILDTAALGSTVDARPLLKAAEAVLLVIEAGKTKHEAVLQLLRDGSLPPEKLTGVVLNKITGA